MVIPGDHIVGLCWRDPEQLVANPANFRVHPREQWDAVYASIEENGWLEPLLENRQTGYLLNGHLRAQIAVEMGLEAVPVMVVDVGPDMEGQIILSLDPTSEMAYADRDVVREVIGNIKTQSEALRKVFDDVLLNSVVSVPEFDEDERRKKALVYLRAEAQRLKRHILEEFQRQEIGATAVAGHLDNVLTILKGEA